MTGGEDGPMRVAAAGRAMDQGRSPAAGPHWWLTGAPPPGRAERLGRLVGLRVFRLPGVNRVLVLAGTTDRLRDLIVDPRSVAPIGRAVVVVAYWRAPRLGWVGRVGPLDHLAGHRVSVPGRGRGPALVRVRLARPTRLRDVLRAALCALAPDRPLPAPASPDLTSQGEPPAYLPAGPAVATALGALPGRAEIRAHDLVFRAGITDPDADHAPGGVRAYAAAWPTGRHTTQPAGRRPMVLVDATRINPRGRRAASYRPDAPRVRLDFGGPGPPRPRWSLDGTPGGPLAGPGLTAPALATLRQVGVVDCPRVPTDVDPAAVAALLVQLAMTGAVLHAPALPERVTELIAPELRGLLAVPAVETDPLAREARSVRQRRAALRGHASALALPGLAGRTFPELARLPAVSAILVTRRPDHLPAALQMIIEQSYPELELVLCPHGVEVPVAVRKLLARCGRPYEIVPVPGTASFGEALGAATRRAGGSLVTKFDDDDSYAVDHVWDLVLARHYSGADLVGKGSEFVYLEPLDVTVRRPSGAAETDAQLVAGGTMLIARGDLEAVGGWRPVPRSADLGLLDRVRRHGGTIYRTHPLGYVYHRRPAGHTWDAGQGYFLDTAYARWPGLPAEVLGGAGRPPRPRGPARAEAESG